jgi:hypothetical protein
MKHQPNVVHPKRKDDHLSKHHCYPLGRMKAKDAPKTDCPSLTIKLWRSRHDNWHKLFHYKTIDEIIEFELWRRDIYLSPHYTKVFKCNRFEAMKILKRFKQIKTRKL